MLTAKRDKVAAKYFLRKALKANHTTKPRVITVDKNASYPPAIEELKKEGLLPNDCETRQVKCLNNIVEQDHRFIKRRVMPGLRFHSFHTAWKTLKGYEITNMIRKGKVEGVEKGDILSQVKFVENLFQANV